LNKYAFVKKGRSKGGGAQGIVVSGMWIVDALKTHQFNNYYCEREIHLAVDADFEDLHTHTHSHTHTHRHTHTHVMPQLFGHAHNCPVFGVPLSPLCFPSAYLPEAFQTIKHKARRAHFVELFCCQLLAANCSKLA